MRPPSDIPVLGLSGLWAGIGLIALGKATTFVDTLRKAANEPGIDWGDVWASLLLGNGALTLAVVAVYAGAVARELPSRVRIALLLVPVVALAAPVLARFFWFVPF